MTTTRRQILAGVLAGITAVTIAAVQTGRLDDDVLTEVLGAKVDKPAGDAKADKKGPLVDASCDLDGVTVSYDASYSASSPAGYKVVTATVGDIAATCGGAEVTVALLAGTRSLASGTVPRATTSSVPVTFSSPPPARDVTSVSVTIAGGTTPIPDDCRSLTFDTFRSLTPAHDTLTASKGHDLVYGLDGNDTLRGDNKDDCLVGQDGDDQLFGDNNDDVLIGGPGDDFLDGGNGRDVCIGGPGENRYLNCEVRR